MTKVEAFIHGIYPRSNGKNGLIEKTQGFHRDRVSRQEVEQQQRADQQACIALQKDQGFQYIEDGKITWQDLFRPFAETTQGLSFEGGLSRWFDNNTFYRKPIITGPLIPDMEKLKKFFPKTTTNADKQFYWKVTLPSPLAFARMTTDMTTHDPKETLQHVSSLLAMTIAHLEMRGVSMIQFQEPYLAYYGTKKTDIRDLLYALSLLGLGKRKAKIAIHFPYGDGKNILRAFEEAEHGDLVDIIGLDIREQGKNTTKPSALPGDISHRLLLGVIDGRNSRLESEHELQTHVETIIHHTNTPYAFVSHTTDLELLPESIARQKVQLLGRLQKKWSTR